MRTTERLYYLQCRKVLNDSHTTQETLSAACEIPLERIKAFLAGALLLTRPEWDRVRLALGIGRRWTRKPCKRLPVRKRRPIY